MINSRNLAQASAQAYVDQGLRQYMLKVYNYMAGGLCMTALVAYLIANTSAIKLFFTVAPNGAVGMSGLAWLALLSPFIMIFAFNWAINSGTMAQVQGIYWGYATLMGAALAPVFIAYTGTSITRIFLITAAMFGGMSIYGYTTRKDLTAMGSFMFMGLWGIIIAMIVNFFLKSPALYYALSALSVVVFTGLTAYDTQKVRAIYAEGDNSDMSSRKAISGALALYMDFINLFLALLRLFGDRR